MSAVVSTDCPLEPIDGTARWSAIPDGSLPPPNAEADVDGRPSASRTPAASESATAERLGPDAPLALVLGCIGEWPPGTTTGSARRAEARSTTRATARPLPAADRACRVREQPEKPCCAGRCIMLYARGELVGPWAVRRWRWRAAGLGGKTQLLLETGPIVKGLWYGDQWGELKRAGMCATRPSFLVLLFLLSCDQMPINQKGGLAVLRGADGGGLPPACAAPQTRTHTPGNGPPSALAPWATTCIWVGCDVRRRRRAGRPAPAAALARTMTHLTHFATPLARIIMRHV